MREKKGSTPSLSATEIKGKGKSECAKGKTGSARNIFE